MTSDGIILGALLLMTAGVLAYLWLQRRRQDRIDRRARSEDVDLGQRIERSRAWIDQL